MKLGTFLLLLVIDILVLMLSIGGLHSQKAWIIACCILLIIITVLTGLVFSIGLIPMITKAIKDNWNTDIEELIP